MQLTALIALLYGGNAVLLRSPRGAAPESKVSHFHAALLKASMHSQQSKVGAAEETMARSVLAMRNMTSMLLRANVLGQKRVDPTEFDPIINSIRDNMRTALGEAVGGIQTDLQAKVDALAACATSFGFDSPGEHKSAYDGAATEHGNAETAVALGIQDKDGKCGTRDIDCSMRDDKAKALYNSVRGSTQCALPKEPAGPFDSRFVLHEVDTWMTQVGQYHTEWQNAVDACSASETACAEAETTLATAEAHQAAMCTEVETEKADGKTAYDECYNMAKGELSGYGWHDVVSGQTSSIEQVETLICYIKVAMKDMGPGGSGKARSDGFCSCADNAADSSVAEGKYKCTCSSQDGHEWDEEYDTGVVVPTEPDKDTAWDDKGCAEAHAHGTTTPAP